MNIEISKIKIHESLQSRDVMSQETIDEYAESILDGVKLPNILLYFDGGTYWLVDGYHRFFAYQKAGHKDLDVDVVNGTFREAELRSTGVNYGHGLQRTNQDKRKAVMKLLNDLEWSEWSDREIARQCNVSNMTVIRIKKSLDIVNVEKKAIRNGTEFKFKPKTVVQKNAEPVQAPSDTPVLDAVHEQLQELASAHELLAEENAKLLDRIAVNAMDATPEEKESAGQTLQELRAIIKTLEAENHALKSSRDSLQEKNAELIKTVAYWKRRAEKSEKLAA
jgi:hypothetical protein